MDGFDEALTQELTEPVEFGAEAYISQTYAREEADKIWRKVWQVACREEELPDPGDYLVYDILDDTILVTRNEEGGLSAFYNVCAHRGKRLASGCGHTKQFRCSYHAWRYDLKGRNTFVLDREDWGDKLKPERLNLPPVRVDTWGGWVWVCMDETAPPLRQYLEPAASMLDPFELEKMRYAWRYRTVFPCNWKTAIEAFLEPYHVEGTHPQLMKFQSYYAWSKAQGIHANSGYAAPRSATKDGLDQAFASTLMRPGKGDDARVSIAALQDEIWLTTRGTTTQTFVDAARRLVDELPAGTPPDQVMAHWMSASERDDNARGVFWPKIDPQHVSACGSSWHLFPNVNVIQSLTNAMYYRVRPHGYDPDQCVFEAIGLELFPEGQAPQTEWIEADAGTAEGRAQWPPILLQDFDNMGDVQKGMRSAGFRSCLTNPQQERKISNFHRTLSQFMGRAGPSPLR
jgi:phenylpropionate dioxygenase-like ring-hydroxylating dioxygenase large terminal subunit